MRQPHVWAVEVADEMDTAHHRSLMRMLWPWREVCAGDEQHARKAFTEEEVRSMGNPLYREIRLWKGDELRLHIWWNR